MSDLNQLDGTSEPQSCYKCGTLPEDILMLACGHDLCLNCAAQRLSMESKRKPSSGIVCEFCNEKTQLDEDSITELMKLVQANDPKPKRDIKQSNMRVYRPLEDEDIRRTQKYNKYERPSRNEKRDYLNPSLGLDPMKPISSANADQHVSYKSSAVSYSGVKKNCAQHPQQQILYYCFECNCECICPECVIHGKHKNHDVKTLKKSQPVIKQKLEYFLQNIDTNIDSLISKKNQFDSHIKQLVQKNNSSKKHIQKSFAELRNKINAKEKEVLAKCNHVLESTIENYQRGIRATMKRIQDIKSSSHTIADNLKKQQLVMLNFYAKKHMQFQQLVDKIDMNSLIDPINDRLLNHDNVLRMVQDISEEIDKIQIDSSVRYDPKYDQKQKQKERQANRHTHQYEESQYSRGGRYNREDEKPSREYMRRY